MIYILQVNCEKIMLYQKACLRHKASEWITYWYLPITDFICDYYVSDVNQLLFIQIYWMFFLQTHRYFFIAETYILLI